MASTFYFASEHQALHLGTNWTINVLIGGVSTIFVVEVFRVFNYKAIHHRKEQMRIATIDWKYLAKFDLYYFLKSIFIVLCIVFLFILNHSLGYDFLSLQAMIAIVVISIQRLKKLSVQRAFHRVRGVFLGTLIALAVVELFVIFKFEASFVLLLIIVTVSTMIFIYLGYRKPNKDYIFLQAAVMVPLILLPMKNSESFNYVFARERSLGSLEGAIVGVLLVLLFMGIMSVLKIKPVKT